MSDAELRALARRAQETGAPEDRAAHRAALARLGLDGQGRPVPAPLRPAVDGDHALLYVGQLRAPLLFDRVPAGVAFCWACAPATQVLEAAVQGRPMTGDFVFMRGDGTLSTRARDGALVGTLVGRARGEGMARVLVESRPGRARTCRHCGGLGGARVPRDFYLAREPFAYATLVELQRTGALPKDAWVVRPAVRGEALVNVPVSIMAACARALGCRVPTVAEWSLAAWGSQEAYEQIPLCPYGARGMFGAVWQRTADGWLCGGEAYRPGCSPCKIAGVADPQHDVGFRLAVSA